MKNLGVARAVVEPVTLVAVVVVVEQVARAVVELVLLPELQGPLVDFVVVVVVVETTAFVLVDFGQVDLLSSSFVVVGWPFGCMALLHSRCQPVLLVMLLAVVLVELVAVVVVVGVAGQRLLLVRRRI